MMSAFNGSTRTVVLLTSSRLGILANMHQMPWPYLLLLCQFPGYIFWQEQILVVCSGLAWAQVCAPIPNIPCGCDKDMPGAIVNMGMILCKNIMYAEHECMPACTFLYKNMLVSISSCQPILCHTVQDNMTDRASHTQTCFLHESMLSSLPGRRTRILVTSPMKWVSLKKRIAPNIQTKEKKHQQETTNEVKPHMHSYKAKGKGNASLARRKVCYMVVLHEIDNKFMHGFKVGVKSNGLQKRVVNNAIIIWVHVIQQPSSASHWFDFTPTLNPCMNLLSISCRLTCCCFMTAPHPRYMFMPQNLQLCNILSFWSSLPCLFSP